MISAPPLLSGRRKRTDLDSSVVSPGAVFCSSPACQKVYVAGKSHASREQHWAFVQPPTQEQWEQHCIGQGTAKEREDIPDSAEQVRSKRRRGDKLGPASAIVHQGDVASNAKLSAAQRKARKPYTFTFGKHYGRTLDHVLRLQPSYIRWLAMESNIPRQPRHFRLKQVLVQAGILKSISGSDDYEAGPRLPKRSNWRFAKFGPPKQPHHCALCNSDEHNIATCVAGSSNLRSKISYKKEQVAKQRRKLLYSGVRKECARQRSRAVSSKRLLLSYDELCAMSEEAVIAHGVSQGVFQGFSTAKQHIAFVRPCSGHGAIGLKKAMRAYWHLCHGKRLADVMEIVRLGENTVARLQRHMLGAVFFDALVMQSENRWGEEGATTRILEGDEKRFKDTTILAENGEMVHRFLPYILFTERGDCEHQDRALKTQIFLQSMGVTQCTGNKRFPKLTLKFCVEAMRVAKIGEHAKVVWMSDGGEDPASAVKAAVRANPNIVQHQTVDHSGSMYARSCMVKDFQLPDGRWVWRQGIAGDQKCEGLFHQLVEFVPPSPRFTDRVPLELWIRYGQWRLMSGCEDVWPRFCKALGAYPQRLQSDDLASQAGCLFVDVARYLRDANARVAATCPPKEPNWQIGYFVKALQRASATLGDIAGVFATREGEGKGG